MKKKNSAVISSSSFKTTSFFISINQVISLITNKMQNLSCHFYHKGNEF